MSKKTQTDTNLFSEEDLRMQLLGHAILLESKSALAKEMGISPAYLSDILNKKRAPGDKVLRSLKMERVTMYRMVK